MKNRKEGLVGKRFGRLTVIRDAGHDRQGQLLWRCECQCGRHINVKTQELQRGRIKHCGCLYEEK